MLNYKILFSYLHLWELYCIKYDHQVNFYISQDIYYEFYWR